MQKTPPPRRSRAFVFIPILLILTIWSYYGFASGSLEFDISNFKLPESSLADDSFCSGPPADDASGASEGTPRSADFIDILSGNPAQSDDATKVDRQAYLDSQDDIVVPGFGHLSFQCSAYLQN